MTERMSTTEYLALVDTKTNKYHAKPCVVNDIRFASRREANRYGELKILERAKKISNLRLQVKFPLSVVRSNSTQSTVVTHYIADFVYTDENGFQIVEDAKGVKTDVYVLKRKMMFAAYGIVIRET